MRSFLTVLVLQVCVLPIAIAVVHYLHWVSP
jgi:hypothetical protein